MWRDAGKNMERWGERRLKGRGKNIKTWERRGKM